MQHHPIHALTAGDEMLRVIVRIRPRSNPSSNAPSITKKDDRTLWIVPVPQVSLSAGSSVTASACTPPPPARGRVTGRTPHRTPRRSKQYSFDRVFGPSATQIDVFAEAEPLVQAAVDGSNATVLAYGPAQSGKSFTIMGTEDHPGLVPRALKHAFTLIARSSQALYSVRLSYVELRDGAFFDLLTEAPATELDLVELENGEIELQGSDTLRSPVKSVGQAMSLICAGNRVRMAHRSHAIFTICIESHNPVSGETARGKLHLVDLAGNEQLGTEASNPVNESLTCLGNVLSVLSSNDGTGEEPPYEDSNLTLFLRDCLSGHSQALMVTTLDPSVSQLRHSSMTLRYAAHAKRIRRQAGASSTDASAQAQQLQAVQRELASLKAAYKELHSAAEAKDAQNQELRAQLKTQSNDHHFLVLQQRLQASSLQQSIHSEALHVAQAQIAVLKAEKDAALTQRRVAVDALRKVVVRCRRVEEENQMLAEVKRMSGVGSVGIGQAMAEKKRLQWMLAQRSQKQAELEAQLVTQQDEIADLKYQLDELRLSQPKPAEKKQKKKAKKPKKSASKRKQRAAQLDDSLGNALEECNAILAAHGISAPDINLAQAVAHMNGQDDSDSPFTVSPLRTSDSNKRAKLSPVAADADAANLSVEDIQDAVAARERAGTIQSAAKENAAVKPAPRTVYDDSDDEDDVAMQDATANVSFSSSFSKAKKGTSKEVRRAKVVAASGAQLFSSFTSGGGIKMSVPKLKVSKS